MKIAVFYHLTAGGAKRTVFEEIRLLSQIHQIDIYKIVSQPDYYQDPSGFAKNVYSYPFSLDNPFPSFVNRLVRDIKNFIILPILHFQIARDIDSKGYDCALVHPDIFTESPFLLRFLKTKKIYFCQELLRIAYEKNLEFTTRVSWPKRYYENFTRKIRKVIDLHNAKRSDVIVTSSYFMKNKIEKAYHKEAVVAHLGVDTAYFKPVRSVKDHFIFMGNKDKIDGWSLVEKAILNNKYSFKVTVLDFKNGKARIENDKELIKCYSSAYALLALDHEEPFGLKVIEANACGTPVIAVADGGYKETVKNGVNGYLIKRDSTELLKYMLKITSDKIAYDKLSISSRKASLRFSWKSHIQIIGRVLNKI